MGLGPGRLPGDLAWRGRHVQVFVPLGTCLVLSVVLTLVLWVLRRRGRDEALAAGFRKAIQAFACTPAFERDCFLPRVAQGEVIPIYLDDTKFAGIPSDLYGIKFSFDSSKSDWQEGVINDIVYKLIEKLN